MSLTKPNLGMYTTYSPRLIENKNITIKSITNLLITIGGKKRGKYLLKPSTWKKNYPFKKGGKKWVLRQPKTAAASFHSQ